MLLRSFGFLNNVTSLDYNFLFGELMNEDGTFSTSDRDWEYCPEIIEAAINGHIKKDEDFNIRAYNKTVKKNLKLANNTYSKRFIDVVDTVDEAKDEGGITIDNLPDKTNKYEVFEDTEELKLTVEKIHSIHMDIMTVYGVDIIHSIRSALQGTPSAVETLSQLCTEDTRIGDYLKIILESGVSFDELFPEDITYINPLRGTARKKLAV